MTTDLQINSSGRTRIYKYPPPPINALVTATQSGPTVHSLYCDVTESFGIPSQTLQYSWFVINLLGCGGQYQPPTPAGSESGINNIFLCVVPSTWPPPWPQMQTINSRINKELIFNNVLCFPLHWPFVFFCIGLCIAWGNLPTLIKAGRIR